VKNRHVLFLSKFSRLEVMGIYLIKIPLSKQRRSRGIPSSGILRREALVITEVSEKRLTSIIRVLRLLVTANAVPSSPIFVTLMMEEIRSSEASVANYY
jgi:hypothetical protein